MKTAANKHVFLILGMLLLLASLPCEWLTIQHTALQMGDAFSLKFAGTPVTGFNGFISVLWVRLPIWLVAALGITGMGLALFNGAGITSLPRPAVWTPLLVSAAFTFFAFANALFSGKTGLGVGIFLALGGLALGGWQICPCRRR